MEDEKYALEISNISTFRLAWTTSDTGRVQALAGMGGRGGPAGRVMTCSCRGLKILADATVADLEPRAWDLVVCPGGMSEPASGKKAAARPPKRLPP